MKHADFRTDRRALLRSFGLLGGLAGVSALLPPGVAHALASSTDAAAFTARYPQVAALVQRYVSERKVAGMVAALGRGQAPVEAMAAGMLAQGGTAPATIDSLWRAYSMTKPVTGMAAMMLIDDGKLQLDQPIADFIPEFADMKVLTSPDDSMDAVPAKTRITVRHLLTHTAGFGYSIITKGPLLKEYLRLGLNPAQVSRKPLPGIEMPAPTPPIDEFARRLASLPLVAEPGTKWRYSVSLDLLGYVIQLASGMEFGAFLQNRMFDPLGMTSSYFQVPDSELGRFSDNYFVFGGALLPIDPAKDSAFSDKPAFPFGGAGLVTSARDYDRFLAMLVGKGQAGDTRIMSEQAVMMGVSNLLPETADTKGTFIEGAHFGAGGRVGVGAEAGTFGWAGAAGTSGFVHMGLGLRAGGFTQYMPSEAYPFLGEFTKAAVIDAMAAR